MVETATMTATATATATPLKSTPSTSSSPFKSKSGHHSHSLLASFVPPPTNKRIVTQKELEENCGIGSTTGRAWTAIHGQVFDITEFSKIHPGGPSIRFAAGRDGTCLVESYHPGSSIVKIEQALFNKSTYIGALQMVDSTIVKTITSTNQVPIYKRPDDSFFLDVRARVDALINNELKSTRYFYDTIGQIEALTTFMIYCVACYQVGVNGSWIWTIILGFLTGRMGFLMHTANHCAISRNPHRNKYIGWFMDLIGSSATIWGYEHQVAHHGEPNEYHHDNDCEIGAPVVRMHPEIPYAPGPMEYQHILIPIAMTIGFFKWYVGDFGHYMRKSVGNVRMAIDRDDWMQLLGFKAFWFLIHIVIPVYFNGIWLALAQCFVFMGVGGHYLENIFIVNHIQNGLVPPADAHWASKQVLATANWKSRSVFWNWVSGGLNHQIEHHMFPAMATYWYPHISATVEQCCKDHGLTYYDYPDFSTAWISMWTYLKDMGREDFVSTTGQKGAPRVEDKKKA